MIKKVAFYTLGCKVNQYETQALREKFSNEGFSVVDETSPADVFVINTCTVTGMADRKSRQYIRRAKRLNPQAIIAVIGCYSQINPEEAAAIDGVDIVLGTDKKSNLIEAIKAYDGKQEIFHSSSEWINYDDLGLITAMDLRTRAYIKIQDGCDRFCSYCIIPYARGPVRSRSLSAIVKEAESLVARGFKEIVLTGINAALYGADFEGRVDGIEIIVNRINEISGDFRIRLGSLEPTVINADYVNRLFKYEKLCPSLHLSLQSGSDRVLKLMNRRYTREDFLKIVETVRRHNPVFGLTTDVIVGFPGESEKDFKDSENVVCGSEFLKTHVFPYSKRTGTKAAEMKQNVSPEEKSTRVGRLAAEAESTALRFLEKNVGLTSRVLFEKKSEKNGLLEGLSDNGITVYTNGPESLCGSFQNVKIKKVMNLGVFGDITELRI